MTFGLHEHWPPISSHERPMLPSMSQLHSKAPSLKSAAKEMTEDLHRSEKKKGKINLGLFDFTKNRVMAEKFCVITRHLVFIHVKVIGATEFYVIVSSKKRLRLKKVFCKTFRWNGSDTFQP